MSRTVGKRPTERRKKQRSPKKKGTSKLLSSQPVAAQPTPELKPEKCAQCSTALSGANPETDRALLVEEEIGRVFCSEDCISAYFLPEIERLEKQYFKLLSPADLTPDEREKFAHLRWVTLEEPDEVWREKTLTGDLRYTLISEFQPHDKKIWCVCICLCLRGEPSFLYLAFPTRNAAMANHYRRGERIEWTKVSRAETPSASESGHANTEASGSATDGLASEWTEDENRRAHRVQDLKAGDIPSSEYEKYERCLDETLEQPDEVWAIDAEEENGPRIYHFLREYPHEKPGYWYVIVARETDEPEQIEIVDSFPTRSGDVVSKYRQGTREIGPTDLDSASRMVH